MEIYLSNTKKNNLHSITNLTSASPCGKRMTYRDTTYIKTGHLKSYALESQHLFHYLKESRKVS